MLQSSQIQENTPVQEITHSKISGYGVRLLLKRDDLVHPDISGNKWRKLKYNLAQASLQRSKILITFGGAFSNHIAATAVAAKLFGFRCIGIIRGESSAADNPTLRLASGKGMELVFISRQEYKEKDSVAFLEKLQQRFPNAYIIPEGGANALGEKGCGEILAGIHEKVDTVAVAIGTGTTFKGLLGKGRETGFQTLGFPVLKGFDDFEKSLLPSLQQYGGVINHGYHFGGYAKYQPELVDFINDFTAETEIALDPIYTGKMMFGIFDLIKKGFFLSGTTILAIHTGGLQGIAGFNARYGNLIK